jgi:hypothetical protein
VLVRIIAVLALIGAGVQVRAQDDPFALYLDGDPEADLTLTSTPPTAEEQRESQELVREQDTGVLGEFIGAPLAEPRLLNAGPAEAVVYLATNKDPMDDCADVHVDVVRDDDAVRTPLAAGQVVTSVKPRREGALTDEIRVPIAVDPAHAVRALVAGTRLVVVVSVRNACENYREIGVIFGSVSQASRVLFADGCPGLANPDQRDTDDDGAGDACDVCPAVADPAQADGDADGVGDACDNCPAAANADQADRNGDGRGDVCAPCRGDEPAICPCDVLDCEEGDPCTEDTCEPGVGCHHAPFEGLAMVACRLEHLRAMVAGAPETELAPRLARKGSRLHRILGHGADAVARLEAVIVDRGVPPHTRRRIRRIDLWLRRFTAAVERGRRRKLIAQPLVERLDLAAAEARFAASQFGP